MSGGTAAVVGVVVVIAGLALADAVRDSPPEPTRTAPQGDATTETDGPGTQPAGPELAGRLVFMDEACSVRVVDLPSEERLPTELVGSCGLWGPARTGLVAYGIGDIRRDVIAFRVADLDGAGPATTGRARPGSVVWSPDGAVVAWCTPRGEGLALDVGGSRRELERCPLAYHYGLPVFAQGRTLRLGPDHVASLPGRISGAAVAENGAVLVVVERRDLFVLPPEDPATPRGPVTLPPGFRGGAPAVSPDGCAALVPSLHRGQAPTVGVFDLGCPDGVLPARLPGHAAAWSPGGVWLAVAGERTIDVYPRNGAAPASSIDEFANQILWKE